MKIFLTGADGFIGSHLAELLVKKGFNVKALTYYNSFNSWGWLDHINQKVRKDIEIITGDIRDEQLISNTIKKKIDVVINLAALIGIPYSYRAPKSYIDTNVYGLMNILNSERNQILKKLFIHLQAKFMVIWSLFPLLRNICIRAISLRCSKIAADQIALSYENLSNYQLRF